MAVCVRPFKSKEKVRSQKRNSTYEYDVSLQMLSLSLLHQPCVLQVHQPTSVCQASTPPNAAVCTFAIAVPFLNITSRTAESDQRAVQNTCIMHTIGETSTTTRNFVIHLTGYNDESSNKSFLRQGGYCVFRGGCMLLALLCRAMCAAL